MQPATRNPQPVTSINRLAIIGVGLIGGSLARALREADVCGEIVGCGRDRAQLEKAAALGIVDRFTTDPAEAVAGADMVVLAVPVGSMGSVFARIAGSLAADAVITDVGSTKASVVAAVREVAGSLPGGFVPGHPIAGTEKSGVEASFASLFQGRRVILTPHETTHAEALARVRAMWEACGAQVTTMGIAHHDEVLAATSHLPHLLAYALVDSLARMEDRTEVFAYAAGGFRDFTRIASSDPTMWRDICLANREALLALLERFGADLSRLTDAVREGDGAQLMETFERAKAARDNFEDPGE